MKMNKSKGKLLTPKPFKNFTTIHDQYTKDIVEICLNAGYDVYVFTDDNDMERQQVFTPTQCCNCGTELSVGIHSIDSANNIEKTIKIYNTCNNCIDEKIARKFIKESCSKAVPDWDECLIGSLWSNGLDDHTCSLFAPYKGDEQLEKTIKELQELRKNSKRTESPCTICGEEGSIVTPKVELIEAEYKGYKKEILSYFRNCNICDSDFGNHIDMKRNKEEMLAFKKEIDLIIEPEYEI